MDFNYLEKEYIMKLAKYNPKYDNLINDYYLPEDQLYYSAMPSEAVEISRNNNDRHTILGLDDSELVTFFILHENDAVQPYSNQPNDILLRSFSTNYKHQGKGYARKTLELLPDFMKEHIPYIDGIVLGVNVKNTAAQGLYKKCGYVDEGNRVMGSKGEMIVMKYYL